MLFGGLQKNSLIDYPGKLSCVLFLSGCNFACPYCHNPDLAKGLAPAYGYLSEQQIFEFLEERKKFLEGVVISGGEPTIYRDVISLCKQIKQIGYSVKLDTNGSNPGLLKTLISKGLIDYIAMDIKTDPENYAPIIQKKSHPKDILSSIEVIMESMLSYEFRTTCIKPLVSERVITNICHIIRGSELYVLQKFQDKKVLNPDFISENDCLIGEGEMMHYQNIAEKAVKKCIVR